MRGHHHYHRMMMKVPLTVFLLLALGEVVSALRNVYVSVPQAIKRGGTAVLTCDFDLEGDSLYSVKWYKGNYEFFRYTPKDENPVKIFPMEGLNIDISKSNMTRLTILSVEPSLTGKYNCEVSVEASFHTELMSGEMEVVDIPTYPPIISDVKPRYRLGEILTANCTSGRSYPPANLTWFINGDMAGLQQVEHSTLPREGRLQRSYSRITFVVKSHDFVSHRLKLRCSAKIHNVYQEVTEKVIDEERVGDSTRVDIVLPANFLDEMDDDGHKKRIFSLGSDKSSCSNLQLTTRWLSVVLAIAYKSILR